MNAANDNTQADNIKSKALSTLGWTFFVINNPGITKIDPMDIGSYILIKSDSYEKVVATVDGSVDVAGLGDSFRAFLKNTIRELDPDNSDDATLSLVSALTDNVKDLTPYSIEDIRKGIDKVADTLTSRRL